ncbi:MAG: hypothetical protein ACXVH0_09960, partial [Thermoanaerobaculia bacterium]
RFHLDWRLEYPIGKVLREGSLHPFGLRVSPDGERVAFGEEGSGAFVVDRSGRTVPILPDKSGEGWIFAGARRTGRFWLSYVPGQRWDSYVPGQRSGAAPNAIWEVVGPLNLRPRLRGTGGFHLADAAPDGRLLVVDQRARSKLFLFEPGAALPRDLSWLSVSNAAALSDDGKTVLFTDTNAKGEGGSVFLRRTDGTPAVRLGEGRALALSPDGRWALAAVTDGLVLYPTGPGQPRAVPFEIKALSASFFPDGKRLLVGGWRKGAAYETDSWFIVPLDGGTPTPGKPGGDAYLSDEGRWLFVRTDDGKNSLVPLDGGAARPIEGLGLGPFEEVIRVRVDDGVLFVWSKEASEVRVDVVELAGGRRREIARLRATNPGPYEGIGTVFMTPDSKTFFYNDLVITSDLYLVEGLK